MSGHPVHPEVKSLASAFQGLLFYWGNLIKKRAFLLDYNPFTLAFTGADASLEPAFLKYYHQDTLRRTRVGTIAAISLYAVFGILDLVMVPDLAHLFWFIRYAVVLPVAAMVVLFSFNRAYERFSQPALFLLGLTGGVGIEIMVMMAGPPAKYSYYAVLSWSLL